MQTKPCHRGLVVVAILTLAAVVLSSVGCGIVKPLRQRRGEAEHAGFLKDYSQLQKKEGYKAQEVYINPAVDWGEDRLQPLDHTQSDFRNAALEDGCSSG